MSESFHFRTEGKPAPGDLALVHGFLNTWSEELGVDDLHAPKAATAWLRWAGLHDGRAALNAAGLEKLVAFRETLRGCVLHPERIEALTGFAGEFRLEAADGALKLQPSEGTVADQAIGRLLAIIFASMNDGTWTRFRCCELPTCGWAFYDHTRSRTKRWCSMKTCGSRHKARAYYERNR